MGFHPKREFLIVIKNYTKIPNEILDECQLTIQARYLYCVLRRHCGNKEFCFPSQDKLAKETGYGARYIRTLLNELENNRLIRRERKGWNRSNTYEVSINLEQVRNNGSLHIGSKYPFQNGSMVPTNMTYLIEKDNNKFIRSNKGMEQLRETLVKRGLIRGVGRTT